MISVMAFFPSVLDHYGSIYSIIISCNDLHEIPQAFLSGFAANDSRETRMKGFHQKGDLCRLPVFAIQRINRINNPKSIGAFWDSRKSATFPERLGTGSEGGTVVCVHYIYIYNYIYIYMYHIYNVYYYILCI